MFKLKNLIIALVLVFILIKVDQSSGGMVMMVVDTLISVALNKE